MYTSKACTDPASFVKLNFPSLTKAGNTVIQPFYEPFLFLPTDCCYETYDQFFRSGEARGQSHDTSNLIDSDFLRFYSLLKIVIVDERYCRHGSSEAAFEEEKRR